MNPKKTIAEQVAEMTQEQQDKVYKVGRVALIIALVVAVPVMIACFYGLWKNLNYESLADIISDEGCRNIRMIICAIGVVFFIGLLLFIKIKYPLYSDRKWWYIRKLRKQNKRK